MTFIYFRKGTWDKMLSTIPKIRETLNIDYDSHIPQQISNEVIEMMSDLNIPNSNSHSDGLSSDGYDLFRLFSYKIVQDIENMIMIEENIMNVKSKIIEDMKKLKNSRLQNKYERQTIIEPKPQPVRKTRVSKTKAVDSVELLDIENSGTNVNVPNLQNTVENIQLISSVATETDLVLNNDLQRQSNIQYSNTNLGAVVEPSLDNIVQIPVDNEINATSTPMVRTELPFDNALITFPAALEVPAIQQIISPSQNRQLLQEIDENLISMPSIMEHNLNIDLDNFGMANPEVIIVFDKI